MDRVHVSNKVGTTSDVLSAWRAIDNGVTAQTAADREKYWKEWIRYAATWKIDPYLQNCDHLDIIIVVGAFAARVRTGFFGRGLQIKVPTVAKALSAITTSIRMVGKSCPFKEAEDEYILPIKRLVEGLRRQDPPPIPQLAVPVSVPEEACRRGLALLCPKEQATGDLINIAFYYLLRCGEYTAPRFVKRRDGSLRRATRTKQFCVGDIGFWKDNALLPRSSPLKILLSADSATMKITNQKNGRMGQTIHHEAFDTDICPIQSLARRVNHILSTGGSDKSFMCEYWDGTSFQTVTPNDLITSIRLSIILLGLDKAGINPDLVGVHSLRAGGAMALKLHGESDTTIMKMGRWSSLTFLMYIHNQIGHLSKDLSSKMRRPVPFLNIAAIEA